jgi:hypothetical protein
MTGMKKMSALAPALTPEVLPRQELPARAEAAPDDGNGLVAMGDFHYAGSPLQRRATDAPTAPIRMAGPAARSKEINRTGLPDQLKAGIESLSGLSLDGVKVHYNSARPAQLMAHAYAQGSQIHLAPGQQSHLPHEAWHLVQQAQGRVAPTTEADGTPVNDDAALEREADLMGRKAAGFRPVSATEIPRVLTPIASTLSKDAGGTAQLGKKRKKKETLLQKLRRSRLRNKLKKATPKSKRGIFRKQAKDNYGYKNADIAKLIAGNPEASTALTLYNPALNPGINPAYSQIGVGDTKGYYRKGFGGQPFLYLDSKAYDDKQIPSNYDDVIARFKGNDAEVAFEILAAIESGESSGKDQEAQAKSLFLLLTQFIEAHSSRVPGSDKLARALLRRIALGQLTFQQAFNRKNGLFVSAWAKKGGAPQGGQVAGRALFGFSKDTDRYDLEKLEAYLGDNLVDELLETIDGYYSDDSDTEDDDEDLAPSTDEKDSASLEEINAALETLQIPQRLSNVNQQVLLPGIGALVKKQSLKLLLQNHPDKEGGSQDAFERIVKARDLLNNLVSQYSNQGFIDLNQRNLDIYLQRDDLAAERVAGDGNCFYAAVLDQILYLDGVNANPATLRQRVAQLILDNAAYFQVFVTGNQLNRIVDDILTSRSWRNIGGDFAPQLMATVLQRPVQIIQPSGPLVIDPIGGLVLNQNNTFITRNQQINIVYDGNAHYDSTRNTRQQLQ